MTELRFYLSLFLPVTVAASVSPGFLRRLLETTFTLRLLTLLLRSFHISRLQAFDVDAVYDIIYSIWILHVS